MDADCNAVEEVRPHRPVRELLRFALRRRRAALPTIARIGPFRFFFYSNEGTEPSHVHVQHESTIRRVLGRRA